MSDVHMKGKVSQQTTAQSITLPPLACVLPIMNPNAISSPRDMPTWLSMYEQNGTYWTRQPFSAAPRFRSHAYGPIVGAFDGGQGLHGHSDWSVTRFFHTVILAFEKFLRISCLPTSFAFSTLTTRTNCLPTI